MEKDTTCTTYIKTLSGQTDGSPVSHTAVDREGGDIQGLKVGGLKVEPLRRAILLLVQDVLLGLLEVFVGDLHAALTQRHEAGFCADGLEERGGH